MRKRSDQARALGDSANKRVALGTLQLSDLEARKHGTSKVAVSRSTSISFDDKENACCKRETLGMPLKGVPFASEEQEIYSTSCDILSIASRGLGGLPMGRVSDDVDKRRIAVIGGMEKVSCVVASEMMSSTDVSFGCPSVGQTTTSLFSPVSPMIVSTTPANGVATVSSMSSLSSGAIRSCGATPDIDRGYLDDFTLCPDYAKEIYDHLMRQEQKYVANPLYMRKQPDITTGMRAILIDWLVEVADEYKLNSQTLYLSISYIDRFLSKMSVMRSKLQLVGAASMLIAAKFEEIHPPEVEEFVYITDDTYTKKQVLKMEHLVLKVLTFDLAAPTILNFLDRYIGVVRANQETEHLAKYFAELTLLDADPYLKYPPSVIAASAVTLALHTFNLQAWSTALTQYSGYTSGNVQACLQDLHCTFAHASRHPQQAVREKYSQARFSSVARISPPSTLPI